MRLYHPLIEGIVEIEPMKPADSGRARAAIKLTAPLKFMLITKQANERLEILPWKVCQ